jgi:biofilm PGA synthesis protein PgaD
MDQSRPRHTALKSPLIERHDLQSPRQRTIYGALTLAFWAFWFYLWLPVLALLAWALGLQQAFKYMVVLGGYHDVIRILGIYSLIIGLLGGCLVLWAVYNILRFRGVERRTAALPVTPAELGKQFGQDPAAVAGWQGGQRLYVTHDQAGRIARVEILAEGAASPHLEPVPGPLAA